MRQLPSATYHARTFPRSEAYSPKRAANARAGCFCNPCLVCGICAIIQEGDVQGLYATGNVDMAWVKSQTATQWRNAALVCAVLYWIFVMAPMMF